jgi:hypothetical protein
MMLMHLIRFFLNSQLIQDSTLIVISIILRQLLWSKIFAIDYSTRKQDLGRLSLADVGSQVIQLTFMIGKNSMMT